MPYVTHKRGDTAAALQISPGALFGDLKILRQLTWKSSGRIMWEAECLCGKLCKVDRSMLVNGRIACMPCQKKYARNNGRQSRSRNLAQRYEQEIRTRWRNFVERCQRLGCELDTTYQVYRAELMNDPDFLAGFDADFVEPAPGVHHEARDYAVLYSEQ